MTATQVPGIYQAIFICFVPCVILIGLRFQSRRLRNVGFWYDDYFAILALVSAVIYDAFTINAIKYGLGLHQEDVPIPMPKARYYQAILQEVQEHTYTAGIGFAQLSLLALYWRLFQRITGPRIVIFILVGCVSTWMIVRTAVSVFQCFPPKFFWDKSIDGECTVSAEKYFLGSVSTHLAMDVALMILPATQISRLQLPFGQKAAIAVMFMFGGVVVVASIVMLVVSSQYDPSNSDTMWDCTPPAVWSSVEVHLSIISCCLPILRPVMHQFSMWWTRTMTFTGDSSTTTSKVANKIESIRLDRWRKPSHRRRVAAMHSLDSFYDSANNTDQVGASIYGQGEPAITVISGNRNLERTIGDTKGEAGEQAVPQVIRVEHEVYLSFTNANGDNPSQLESGTRPR